jgi:hypothetical protein
MKKLYLNAMRFYWGYGSSLTERNVNAYEQTMKIFKDFSSKIFIKLKEFQESCYVHHVGKVSFGQ